MELAVAPEPVAVPVREAETPLLPVAVAEDPDAVPVGVAEPSAAKRTDDSKVTQFDDEGIGAVKGIEVMGPSDSGGWV